MISLESFNAKILGAKLKCTIQATGKLGFTEATIRALEIEDKSAFLIYPDQQNKTIMYLVKSTREDERAFGVCRTGKYYYLNTKGLFDMLKWDYKNHTYVFDLTEDPKTAEQLGAATFVMTRREVTKSNQEEDENPEMDAE